VDFAKKQRHLSLLRKIKETQVLTAAELAELQGYESQSPAAKKNRPSSIVPAPAGKYRQSAKLTEAAAQRLGYACKDIAEADAQSGIKPNLVKYFERHPRLRAAFDRGRLLKLLCELGPVAEVYEAAKRLKDLGFSQFESGQALRDFLDRDKEAGELWESARANAFITNRENMRKTAGEGNVAAIKFMDRWAVDRQRETGDPASANFNRVGVNQMAELFSVTRTTIYQWYTEKGLPQNTDGSFDLQRAIAWYEEFTLKKTVRGKDAISPLSPFQDVKVKHMQLKLEQEQGELANRGEILGFQMAMMQNVVNAFNAASDLANRIFGQPREQIVERLEDFRDEVMAKLQHIPAELKLSEPALAKLGELYEMIRPQSDKEQETGHRIQDTEQEKGR